MSDNQRVLVKAVKAGIRFFLYAGIVVFGLLSLLVLLSGRQIDKNRLILADMQDRVTAIKAFVESNKRLPTTDELEEISKALSVRYHRYQYEIETSVSSATTFPSGMPTGGWVLSFWRGEWTEYYSSWDEKYTLSEQATWLGFCGPLLLAPLITAILVLAIRHPALKTNKLATANM